MRDPAGRPERVTQVLEELRRDAPGAQEELFQLVYGELHRIAASFMNAQPKGHTLQPTALVHEAYLKLMGTEGATWQDKAHFMSAAGRAMRNILVDFARARAAEKRGGQRLRITLDDALHAERDPTEDILAVHEALQKLEAIDPQWCRVVELRFFAGLGPEEIARVLGTSPVTVHRDWHHARAWLFRELSR